ncbi:MAG: Lrp/AsnC family transcriptional regulator [Candidatus Micrarchaeota archaeon]
MPDPELDEIDHELLQILQADASLSYKQIAKRTQLPSSTVFHRIKQMKENGVILGETIRIDNKKAGTPLGIIMSIRLDNNQLTEEKRRSLARKIMANPYVEFVADVTGRADLILKAYVPSIDKLEELVIGQMREIEGVVSTESFVIIKESRRY